MCAMTARGYEGRGSPDRADALVWALTDLIVEASARWRAPRMRAM
jgi:phage terminase large subunit-like protein